MEALNEMPAATSSLNNDTIKVGICLSGGCALGFGHIGVLQALEEYYIYPKAVSGTGIGAIIGAMYAAGYTPAQILQFAKENKWHQLISTMSFAPAFWETSYANHHTILNLMQEVIPNNSFEKLEKKMFVGVSNLKTGSPEVISEGENLNYWIAASCSIPGIFNGVKIDNTLYTYGGLLNNMPAQPLAGICDMIIGSDVLPYRCANKISMPKNVLFASLRAVLHQNALSGRALCTHIVESDSSNKYHEFSFDAFYTIYQCGYKSAQNYIIANKEILCAQTKRRRGTR